MGRVPSRGTRSLDTACGQGRIGVVQEQQVGCHQCQAKHAVLKGRVVREAHMQRHLGCFAKPGDVLRGGDQQLRKPLREGRRRGLTQTRKGLQQSRRAQA